MRNFLLPVFFISILLTSCTGSRDEQFCNCLKASEDLNAISTELLKGNIDQAKADKLKELKKIKQDACKDYTFMNGKEMLERKAECK